MKKPIENIEQKLFDNMKMLNPNFVRKQILNEGEEKKEKWIQKADMKKGALHDRLGIPEEDKIPMSVINRHIKILEKKSEGDKKLSPDDAKFMRQLVAAKNMKSLDEDEDVFRKHQIAIAKKTLGMSDMGAQIMGGMTKDEAKIILKKFGVPIPNDGVKDKKKINEGVGGDVIYVVFDGTSHYITPESEFDPTNEKVVRKLYDMDKAQELVDQLNGEAYPKEITEKAPTMNDTYFETLSEALEYVREKVEQKGYSVDEDQMFNQFGTGGVGYGETKRANLQLLRDGVPAKNRSITVVIYRMDSGRYELTSYIN